jgi:hypothetical protein
VTNAAPVQRGPQSSRARWRFGIRRPPAQSSISIPSYAAETRSARSVLDISS